LAHEQTWSRRRVRRRRNDGSLLWGDLMRGPIVGTGRRAIKAIQVDVTRGVETESALRRNEERFRAVIDHLPVSLTLKGADRRFLIVNQTFERWSGVGAADAIGKTREETALGPS